MHKRRSQGSPTLVLIVVAAVLIFIPAAFSKNIKLFVIQAFSPIQKGTSSVRTKFKRAKTDLLSYFNNNYDAHRMREKVRGLENQVNQLQELGLENKRLAQLADLKQHLSYPSVVSRVIGWDTSAWTSSLIIDKGTKHGITKDMAVVFESGLVGRVIESGRFVSRVLLITDPQNNVGARMQRTREIGIVQGASKTNCKMTYMSKFADIKKGDLVVTSGLSTFYPKGIPIGRITEIYSDESNLYKYAYLEPVVDFSVLEEVVVLKWKQD